MGKVEDLADRFGEYLAVPHNTTGTAAERVLMVVYDKELERTLRERMAAFETRAVAAGRQWIVVDCTPLFSSWMAGLDYREAYFI